MKTITEALLQSRNRPHYKIAVEFLYNGQWKKKTWKDYYSDCESLGHILNSLNIKKGDKVCIFSNTRYEWAISDMASLGIGAVTVPIYASSTVEDISFIINNCEAKLLFIENKELFIKWNLCKDKCSNIKQIISFDKINDEILLFKDLIEKGKNNFKDNPKFFENSCQSINPEDLATLCYTSGTTGTPKGVMLNHRCLISEVSDVFRVIGIDESDTSLTFLPFSHILARVEHLAHIYRGFKMGYAENVDKVKDNLAIIKPTFLIAVPRIFEKIYGGIISQAESSPIKKRIFYWALSIGKEVSRHKIQRKTIPLPLLLQYEIAKRLVFDKIYQKLGGKLRFCVSGGAPLSQEIAEFFHAANILLLEGYGLTETTAAVFLNVPYDFKFGTVGKAIGDVKVKIAEDGEILVKTDKNMQGYYKNDEATKEVLIDGWFATGDIGVLDESGFLKITDRKKDLIKNAGGKFIAPQKLENKLKLSKYISNVLIHGDKRKFVVALITLAKENFKEFPQNQLHKNRDVMEIIRNVIAEVNSDLASYESIKNFAILENDFTIETGELTPSLKVKRKYCDQKFNDLLDSLYV